MKNRLVCFEIICITLLSILSGCGQTPAENVQTVTLRWLLPGMGKPIDSQKVFSEVNTLISQRLKDVYVDFIIVNRYEYEQKLKLYLAASEQFDIAWCSDTMLPYLLELDKSTFKLLTDLISSMAPNIKNNIPGDVVKKTTIVDKQYTIPHLYSSSGLIPFIKIPVGLKQYMDIEKLTRTMLNSETASENCYAALDEYLENLKSAGKIGHGADVYSLNDVLPYKGYETIVSTSRLFGYRKNYSKVKIVNMLQTPETSTFVNKVEDWYKRGFVREDIMVVKNKKDLLGPDRQILQGVWGYFNNGSLQTIGDSNHTGDYLYIPIDNNCYTSEIYMGNMTFIPKNSKYYEQAIKVLDLIYSKDDPSIYNTLAYGIEGLHYKKTASNRVITSDDPAKYIMYPEVIGNPTYSFLLNTSRPLSEKDFRKVPNRMDNFKLNTIEIQKDLYKMIVNVKDNDRYFLGKNCGAEYQKLIKKISEYGSAKIEREIQNQVDSYLK